MTSKTISARLTALEQQSGANRRTIVVWRCDDDAEFQARLSDAENRAGPNDVVQVVGWIREGSEDGESAQF